MEPTRSFRPLSDWIVIKPDPEENRTYNGLLHVPDTAKQRMSHTQFGTIVAAGPGGHEIAGHDWQGNYRAIRQPKGQRYPIEVKVGDRVVFERSDGHHRIDFHGIDCVVLHEEQFIHAVIDDGDQQMRQFGIERWILGSEQPDMEMYCMLCNSVHSKAAGHVA